MSHFNLKVPDLLARVKLVGWRAQAGVVNELMLKLRTDMLDRYLFAIKDDLVLNQPAYRCKGLPMNPLTCPQST